MFKKVFFILLFGILTTIFFAQYDQWTHNKIILLLQKVAKETLFGNLSCSIKSVNFFSPSLVLHTIEMKSFDGAWVWRCKKCELTCSWIQLFSKGIVDQYIIVDGFECTSHIEGYCLAIEPHIMAMMQQSLLPFSTQVKSIIFKNARFCINDEQGESEASLFFNSSSLRSGHHVKTTMSINDGQLKYSAHNYIENGAADLFFTTEYSENTYAMSMHVAGTFFLSDMDDQGTCYVTGQWKNNRGRFSIRNAYNSFNIDPIIITEREFRINAHFPLSYIARCIKNFPQDRIISGTAHCSVKAVRDESRAVDGQIVVEDVSVNSHHLCDSGKVIFSRYHGDWKARGEMNRHNQECKGVGYWHEYSQKGECNFKNSNNLFTKKLPHWQIKHDDFYLRATVNKGEVQGAYEVVATNVLNDERRCSNGSFSYKNRAFLTQGLIDANQFLIDIAMSPHVAIHCVYKNSEDKSLISLQSVEKGNKINGLISFPFIRSLINSALKYDIQGEGNLGFVIEPSIRQIVTNFTLNDAAIRLPQTYNFIDGFKARCTYDMLHNTAILEDMSLSLHTGNIDCLRATTHFDERGSLIFAHAPVILDRCLLNIRKDLFAIVSGSLLFSKTALSQSVACVSGTIIIDKAQLKENLFSGIVQKQLLSYTHSALCLPEETLKCDVAIETKFPISIDTGFLQANAHLNMNIKGGLHDPLITGAVVLGSGILNFPYKPLRIIHGSIIFSSDRLLDPSVELIARSKIKKYDISLQIEGSLSAHHITLDSTPSLSEEQIVGLLLVGSEENSLNSMMPALIVQNLKNLIFSNNQTSFFDKYFKPLLGPLSINLVPSFSDQTGRGGLRGAVEITIDDRWRAVIQKNFSLTEDTKFELEFLATDDITLRAIRDERRDLGGEVEMRWKF